MMLCPQVLKNIFGGDGLPRELSRSANDATSSGNFLIEVMTDQEQMSRMLNRWC